MADNLSTIGFAFASDEDFRAGMTAIGEAASERLDVEGGEYAIWRSDTGAQVWFHIAAGADGAAERDIVGLTPFYEGLSVVPLSVMARVRRPDDNAFEGAFRAWVRDGEDADDGEPLDDGAYPIVLDAVDFAAHVGRELPAVWSARVCGFARQIRAFPTQEAFRSEGGDEALGLTAQSFFPLGLFREEAELAAEEASGRPAQATALLTGIVRAHRLHRNEATGATFHALLVESYAATFDVVAAPEVVEGEIAVGGVVECTCWLVGRMLG